MMEKLPFVILVILLCFLPIDLQAKDRSLIQFNPQEREQIKEQIIQLGGTVMVEWSGGLWVRWADNKSTPLSTSSDFNVVLGIESFDHWMNANPKLLEHPLECDIEEVEKSLKRSSVGTSDSLSGHTVCALFFVNQINSVNPWSIEEQEDVMMNVALNLAWWSEQAWFYEIEASFEIKPYYFDDPVCQVTDDPTLTTGRPWALEIMDAVGYDRGSLNDRQLDFTRDLIEEYDSDWGFIAYIIRGASGYRSNAQIFGPSTTVHFPAARSSLVFAHEVGHIFGLRDEYEERAFGTLSWSMNQLDNLNADFRNLVNAPCIMKTASIPVGMCCYNAVHLAWTPIAEEILVITEPEDAIFTVQYLNTATDQVFLERLHQGYTVLPVGRGQKINLFAEDSIRVRSGIYSHPVWIESGSPFLAITADGILNQVQLAYEKVADPQEYVEFLEIGSQIPSRKIQAIAKDELGGLFILSNQGVGYFNGEELIIFDREFEVRPGEYISQYLGGNSVTAVDHLDNTWLVSGSVLANRPFAFLIQNGEQIDFFETPNEFREEGVYTSAVLTDSNVLLAAFNQGGLHRYFPDGTFDVMTMNNGLPSDEVSVIQMDKNGKILLGYDGGRTGTGFKGLYELNTENWSVSSYSEVPVEIQNGMIRNIKFFDSKNIMAIMTRDEFYHNLTGEWEELNSPASIIFDADLTFDSRWILGTSSGVHFQDEADNWVHLSRNQNLLQDNFVRAVLKNEDGSLLIGHLNYGLTVFNSKDESTSVRDYQIDLKDLKLYPNPVTDSHVYIEGVEEKGNHQLKIYDLSGKLIVQNIIYQDEAGNTIPLKIKLENGIYLVSLKNSTINYIGKLVVQR